MTSTTYVSRTFFGIDVNIRCEGDKQFLGKVSNCDKGKVTLLSRDGPVRIDAENILSISPCL